MGYRAENLLRLSKAAAPTLLGLAGVIILALPIRLFEGLTPTPAIPLVVVFFWSVYGPDFLTGAPLGLWAGVYLVCQFAVLSQRSYFLGRDQKVVWIGFALVAAAASLILWLVMSLMSGVLLPLRGLAAQMTATVLIYPLFGVAFRHLHRRVLVEA
jgi:rod shape-determining protein MreD